MAIKISQGFEILSKQPIDTRLLLTKEEMKNAVDSLMPKYYFTVCFDDGLLYMYDKSITNADPETGKFRVVDSVLDLNKIAGVIDGGQVE